MNVTSMILDNLALIERSELLGEQGEKIAVSNTNEVRIAVEQVGDHLCDFITGVMFTHVKFCELGDQWIITSIISQPRDMQGVHRRVADGRPFGP